MLYQVWRTGREETGDSANMITQLNFRCLSIVVFTNNRDHAPSFRPLKRSTQIKLTHFRPIMRTRIQNTFPTNVMYSCIVEVF